MEDLPDDLPLWQDVAATSENCVGTDCPAYRECFVTTMRQRAAESDIVIVNHHLLCADAAVRQGDYGEVIPACDVAVIDEAHQLEDVATQYFGIAVSTRRFEELDRDVHRLVSGESAADMDDAAAREILGLLDRVRDGARMLFAVLGPAAAASGDRTRMTSESLATAAEAGRSLGSRLRRARSGAHAAGRVDRQCRSGLARKPDG